MKKSLLTLLLCIPALSLAAINNPPPRILMVVSSHGKLGNTDRKTGYYLSELTHPYYRFKQAGYKITIVSPQGGDAPMYAVKKSDPINRRFLNSANAMKQVQNTLKPSEINPKNYAAIYYAGGTGTMWDFPQNKKLADIASTIYEQGGVVSADCHGPAALLNVKLKNDKRLIQGKNLTSFTNAEEKAAGFTKYAPFSLEDALIKQGANYKAAPNFTSHVVIDGRLITGQNPASATAVADAVIKKLN
jgi:putative intracellular protease/amidase